MFSLQALMAINAETLKSVGIIAAALLLVIAFCVGFSKGFREIGKGGLLWAISGAAFIVLHKFIGKDNPLGNVLEGGALNFVNFLWAFLLIVVCIVATLILGGVCAIVFRPIEDKSKHMSMTIDGLEYEIEEMEVARPTLRQTSKYIPRLKKPTFWGRLFGGVLCVANVGAIIGIVGLSLLVLASTTSVGGVLQPLFDHPTLGKVMGYVQKYIFDVLTVGIVFAIARKGFNTGLVGTARILFARLGMLVALVFGLALPFLGFFQNIAVMENAVAVIASKLSVLGALDVIAARAILGVGFAIVLCLLMAGLNALLRDLTYNIEETKFIRFLDGFLAAIIYILLGAILCVLLWGGLYIVDYLGVCNLEGFLAEGTFSSECFKIAKDLVSGLA